MAVPGSMRMRAIFVSCVLILNYLADVAHGQGSSVPEITDYSVLDNQNFPESLPVGTLLGRILASDPDGDPVTFAILENGGEYFSVNKDTGEVTLKQNLDFETETEIRFIIRVDDTTGQFSTRDGKVFVDDENDNPPEFAEEAIFRDVSESAPIGSVITIISVRDLDTKNDPITITCDGTTALFKDACETFDLKLTQNSNKDWNGTIVLKRRVDFERRKSYNIPLRATDGVFNTTNEVHIEVQDVNDAPPRWVDADPKDIDEEMPIGSSIQRVSAVDGDLTNPRSIRYEIVSGGNTFEISSTTGVITNKVRLDYDAIDFPKGIPYDVTIKAREVINATSGELGNDRLTTATIAIKITVNDINDNSPLFSETEYTAYIDEDIVSNANVPGLQMTITDIDSGTFNSFDLLTLNYTDVFGIIPSNDAASSSATLFVRDGEKIDYEKGPRTYVIHVWARENMVTTGIHTGSATVTIHVRDVNDETPSFDSNSYVRYVSELAPPSFKIIDLNATDPEAGDFGTVGIRYQLFGNIPQHFEIDPVTGVVSVRSCRGNPGEPPCIDYERKQTYTLTVSATDNRGVVPPGRTRSVQLTIRIIDENDNIPQIVQNYVRYIYEGERTTINPLRIEPIDPDTVGKPLTFAIQGDQSGLWNIFSIDGPSNRTVGEINASRAIFYRDTSNGEFNFAVNVQDRKYSTSAQVKIIVIDINNNAPEFVTNEFVTQIREDTLGDVSVIRVSATDGDAPTTSNGIIDFYIASGALGKFRIANVMQNGQYFEADIYTTTDALFNYDTQREYVMELIARDRGTPDSKFGTARLRVQILDVNNKDPIIYPSFNSVTVKEDEPIGFLVYTVTARDPDANKILRFSMVATEATDGLGRVIDRNNYNFSRLFTIEPDTGNVRVAAPLDRDNASRVTHALLVEDTRVTPPQEGRGTLMIYVLEVNDQAPRFDRPLYEITIDEEENINAFVLSLNCIDSDDKISGYGLTQLSPRAPNYFDLVPGSGAMIVADRIDFETMDDPTIELRATCTDTGQPRLSNTSRILVHVRNINDNSPVFERPLYRAQIEENTIGGRLNVTISASDADKGDFGVVRYMLENETMFTIDEMTAEITILPTALFDRENSSSFGFQVIAYDSPLNATVRRRTSVPVYITILDVNDNCPTFSKRLYMGTVPESAALDTDIIDILVRDADTGINAEVVFSVDRASGNPPESVDLFGIGRTSGRVLVRQNLKNKEGIYTFNVTATDMRGQSIGQQCTSEVPVTVEVLQSDNEAPNWIKPPNRDYRIYVLESQYEGMLVYGSKANDSNTGPSGVVDYYFTINGNELVDRTPEFMINRVTGVIRAEVVFDREQRDNYFLTLMAKDRGNPAASSETTLTVIILDVDDNDPVFPMRNGQVIPLVLKPVTENSTGPIGQCSATDADSDVENNRIYYELLQEDLNSYIDVNPKTCVIRLNKSVNFEKMPTLEFDIYAYNKKNYDVVKRQKRAVNHSIQHVILPVLDSNDNAPVFSQSEYLACVSFDAPYREAILEVAATDQDIGVKTQLNYTVSANGFDIDSKLGIIRNTVSFSNSKGEVFSFPVTVSDGEKSATAPVHIFVVSPSEFAKLVINKPLTDVEPFEQTIVDTLISASEGSISFACVNTMRSHIDDNGDLDEKKTDVFVAAVRKIDGRYVLYGTDDLSSRLEERRETPGENPFGSIDLERTEADSGDDDWILEEDAVLVILIICILLIALALLLCIIACICLRGQERRKVKKIRAQRHTIVAVGAEPIDTSFNPVYTVQEPPPPVDEYATVQKVQHAAPPINTVVIPAPENLQPLQSEEPQDLQPAEPVRTWEHEEPEPVIETEIVPDPVDIPEPEPQVYRPFEPEYEDRIETVVIDDDERPPTPPEPMRQFDSDGEHDDTDSNIDADVISQTSTEQNLPEPLDHFEPEEASIHSETVSLGIPDSLPPAPAQDEEIEVIIQDSPNPSPSPSPPPSPPQERRADDSD